MGSDQLSTCVQQAKEAVDGLEEPYKTEAFKIILEKLTSKELEAPGKPNGEGEKSEEKKKKKTKKKASQTKPSQNKTAKKREKVSSSLNLSTAQLTDLKNYYSRFAIKGGEVCVFILGCFIHEKLKQDFFIDEDIAVCYRALISMKVPVPPIKNTHQAAGWLTAPSRKKEWFNKNDQGFSVSNTGLIVLADMERKLTNTSED